MNPLPEVRGSHCTRYRFRYSECSRCQEACPHNAIELSDEGASIAQDRCRGCGLCVAACATEAFTLASVGPLALVEKAKGREVVSIACTPSGRSADVQVPCLGALGAPLVAYLMRQGTRVRLCGAEHCADCEHGKTGGGRLAHQLEAVEVLRTASSQPGSSLELVRGSASRRRAVTPDAGMARRAFFRRIGTPAAGAAVPPQAAIPLRAVRAARPVACAQRDLVQLLTLDAPMPAHDAVPSGEVRLGAGCTGCEACARACPTGALQIRESDTRWTLLFDRRNCVGCSVCVEACQPGVLELAGEVPRVEALAEPAALLVRPKQRCQRCDRTFVSAEPADMCSVCIGDDQDFDDIFG